MDKKNIEQMIKEKYPTSYENITYGSLSMLYDDIKNVDLSKLTDDKLRLLYFQIYDITNDAINYAKTNILKADKLDTLIMKVEAINKIKDKINVVSNDDLLELKIAFDFELDSKKEIKLIEGAANIETRIRASIETNKNTIELSNNIFFKTLSIDEEKLYLKNKEIIQSFAEPLKDKCFKLPTDYESYIDILTNYFCNIPIDFSNTNTIDLKRGKKTQTAKIFNPIHRELKEIPLKSDVSYFEVIRILNHFKTLTDSEIYCAITG